MVRNQVSIEGVHRRFGSGLSFQVYGALDVFSSLWMLRCDLGKIEDELSYIRYAGEEHAERDLEQHPDR